MPTRRSSSSISVVRCTIFSIAQILAYDEITASCTHLATVCTHLDEIAVIRRVHPDVVDAELVRRHEEHTQATPDRPIDEKQLYYDAAGEG
ncbi:hypothetical protein Syun_028225 [Stephania yunnanensis]|uniref:Uncharacterized protein n=1 Tax=Stephania yunnanensis TaxID=152371 RepID=A0AAP0HNK3_9MAGN